MRKSYRSYSLLTLGGVFLVGSCSIIAEVDRTKIPQDGGTTPEGGQGTGGSSGSSGRGGSSGEAGNGGTSGTSGTSGMAGDGGMGGEPVTGGTGGTGATDGGMGGETPGGMGGEGGMTPTAECGNGEIEAGEECDDDGVIDGNGCDSDCQEEPGWTCSGEPSTCTAALCGDRIQAGAEACDDGNSSACGTCTAGCGADVVSAAATGRIDPGGAADLADGDYFTLNDGSGAQEFEFDTNSDGASRSGAVAIAVSTGATAGQLQAAIVGAIQNASAFGITAENGVSEPAVTLTNEAPGSAGNVLITENVGSSAFMVTGMAGGAAHDCATGVGCADDDDCLNGTCSTTTHVCN
jgi:cysteine-rich repeat protein